MSLEARVISTGSTSRRVAVSASWPTGVPFLAVFNHWRGSNRGGGEWARSEELYPFPHG
jgi:hypothetical protein